MKRLDIGNSEAGVTVKLFKSLDLTEDEVKKTETRHFSRAEMCSLNRLPVNFSDFEVRSYQR